MLPVREDEFRRILAQIEDSYSVKKGYSAIQIRLIFSHIKELPLWAVERIRDNFLMDERYLPFPKKWAEQAALMKARIRNQNRNVGREEEPEVYRCDACSDWGLVFIHPDFTDGVEGILANCYCGPHHGLVNKGEEGLRRLDKDIDACMVDRSQLKSLVPKTKEERSLSNGAPLIQRFRGMLGVSREYWRNNAEKC